MQGRAGGNDAKRQRQAAAAPQQQRDRVRFGGQAVRAEVTAQQVTGLVLGEHGKCQRAGTVGDEQPRPS